MLSLLIFSLAYLTMCTYLQAIKIWSLSWGVPGWIGNTSGHPATYYCDDNIEYQVACISNYFG